MVVLGLCCCAGFSLVAVSRGYSIVAEPGLLIVVAFLSAEQGSRARGLQSLRRMGSVALLYVGSSRIRGQTCVSCVGRWILYHWAITEALCACLLNTF